MNKEIGIVAVHVGNRWALTDDGQYLHICDLYDEYGEETQEPEIAVAGVCKCEGGWITLDFDEFEEVENLH